MRDRELITLFHEITGPPSRGTFTEIIHTEMAADARAKIIEIFTGKPVSVMLDGATVADQQVFVAMISDGVSEAVLEINGRPHSSAVDIETQFTSISAQYEELNLHQAEVVVADGAPGNMAARLPTRDQVCVSHTFHLMSMDLMEVFPDLRKKVERMVWLLNASSYRTRMGRLKEFFPSFPKLPHKFRRGPRVKFVSKLPDIWPDIWPGCMSFGRTRPASQPNIGASSRACRQTRPRSARQLSCLS